MQRAKRRLHENLIYALGIAFFLFMISLVWFINGTNPILAAIFRVEYFKYEWVAAHLGVGVFCILFFILNKFFKRQKLDGS